MKRRYVEAVERIGRRLGGRAGVVLVQVPPMQAETVGDMVVERFGARRIDWTEVPGLGGGAVVLIGPPAMTDGPQSLAAAMAGLNGARSSLASRGAQVFVVLEPAARHLWLQHCPDADAALAAQAEVRYEPSGTATLAAARRELAEVYRARLRRLDLRGLVRSESEDVGRDVLVLYQGLRATVRSLGGPLAEGHSALSIDTLIARHVAARGRGAPVVLLGGPGSGKSFYLRRCALHGSTHALFGVAKPVPVLVHAGALDPRSELPLRTQIVEHLLAWAPITADYLAAPRVRTSLVLLVDGLDEVAEPSLLATWLAAGLTTTAAAVSVLASRPAGYETRPIPSALHAEVADLGPAQIAEFLTLWCGLYARDRDGEAAEAAGRAEGASLAHEIDARPSLAALAGNPLLLTVMAIVHRAGVRLPDHRVELYSHMTHVLIERWNRVRSQSATDGAPALRTGQALRVLGPLALNLVSSGFRAAIPEHELRAAVERALGGGYLPGIGTPDEALSTIRDTLGLLVEQSPGAYGFIHLSLGEYLAGRELIRSNQLEALVADAGRLFAPTWREPLLLALGELGLIRGEDDHLEKVVERMCRTIEANEWGGFFGAPALVASMLLDDPMLSETSARGLIAFLLPMAVEAPQWEGDTSTVPVEELARVYMLPETALERLGDPRSRLHGPARAIARETFQSDFAKVWAAARSPRAGRFTRDGVLDAWRALGLDPVEFLVRQAKSRNGADVALQWLSARVRVWSMAIQLERNPFRIPAGLLAPLRHTFPRMGVEFQIESVSAGKRQRLAFIPIDAIPAVVVDHDDVELQLTVPPEFKWTSGSMPSAQILAEPPSPPPG